MGRYPVAWNNGTHYNSSSCFTCNKTNNTAVRLYHHHQKSFSRDKNNRVMLATLQNEERQTAEGLLEWIWKQVKVPKGFENFFPKNRGGRPSSSKKTQTSKNAKDETKKE